MKRTGEKQGYIIHKVTDSNYLLCKVLKEYDNIQDSKTDLIKLLSNNTTERKILKGK